MNGSSWSRPESNAVRESRRKRHPLDFDVTLWETEASAPLSRFTGMQSPPTTVAFAGENRVLGLTGSVLRVWRLDP